MPKSWDLLALPKTFSTVLYVEGVAPSVVTKDVELMLDVLLQTGDSCEDRVKVTAMSFELRSMGFDSDHGLMLDNNVDFNPTGTLFEEPEWGPAVTPPRDNPISHTMAENVNVTLFLIVTPDDTPEMTYTITGDSVTAGFSFEQDIALAGGLNISPATSTDLIEGTIQEIDPLIEWRVTGNGCDIVFATSGPHKVYVTVGIPRDSAVPQHVVTQKRMERAVEQAGAANSLNPHTIVGNVINSQGGFDLTQFRQNAWLVPDLGGDCRSIVRFAEKVAKMIDVPGTFQHANIYAKADAPTVAIEQIQGQCGGNCDGFNSDPQWHANGVWVLQLIDAAGGCNAFEATAKFSACGVTRFYPGGVPNAVFDSKDDVLKVFDKLAYVVNAAPPPICDVQEIVHVYGPVPASAPTPTCP